MRGNKLAKAEKKKTKKSKLIPIMMKNVSEAFQPPFDGKLRNRAERKKKTALKLN